MHKFKIEASGDRAERIELEMPTVEIITDMISALWTHEIFRNEGGSPFTYATIQRDGRIVAYGWLAESGWKWENIEG